MPPVAEPIERTAADASDSVRIRRAVFVLLVAGALVTGVAAGRMYAPLSPSDADFLLLIRFMAVMKLAIVLACAAAVAWRVGAGIAKPLAFGYAGAVALMALSPGLIWSEALLPLASAVFNAGLLLSLALAAGDGMSRRRA